MKTPGADDVRDAAATLHDSSAYQLLVRAGLIAYGIVHLLIAYLAVRLALGQPAEEASQTGALRQLAEAPLGTIALAAVALGLAIISLWQLLTAVLRRETDRAKRANVFQRPSQLVGLLVVTVIAVALAGL